MKILAICTFLALTACQTIKYQNDVGFLVSAQAGSPEFPVYINGKLCVDMDGQPGQCAKRVANNQDLIFKIDPQAYDFKIHFSCSAAVSSDFNQDVKKQVPYTFTMSHTKFGAQNSFICIGEVFPSDRDDEVSARFEIRVKVMDSKYVPRETMYIDQPNDVVFGQYAYSTHYFDGDKWQVLSGKTSITAKDPKKVKAYSESYMMRFNYIGLVP